MYAEEREGKATVLNPPPTSTEKEEFFLKGIRMQYKSVMGNCAPEGIEYGHAIGMHMQVLIRKKI